MAKIVHKGWAKPDDPIYKTGPVIGAIRIGPSLEMGKFIHHDWQEKAGKDPQPTGTFTGQNLKPPKSPSKPVRKKKSVQL